MPADKAAAVGEVAGSTAGHVDPEAARILAEQQASESQQRLDARWRPIRQEEGQQAAEREAEARSAARAAAAARQPAPRTSSGAEIVAAQPSVPSEQLKSLRADEELANRSAGIEDAGEHAAPGAQAATGGRTGAEEAGKAATAKAARAAGAAAGVAGAGAVAGGAAGAAQGAAGAAGSGAADAALAKAMQRADEAHAAGSGAGQGTVADRGAAAGAAAGQPERAEGAGQPDGGGQRPTPVGSMKLKPTPPASVRSADGFSPIILAPENMARLGALCEQPIDLCGQKVFDELFSPESFSELSPGQVQRERLSTPTAPSSAPSTWSPWSICRTTPCWASASASSSSAAALAGWRLPPAGSCAAAAARSASTTGPRAIAGRIRRGSEIRGARCSGATVQVELRWLRC